VTYPQDQDYRASGAVRDTDHDPEALDNEDVARAEPDDDEDVAVEHDVIVAEVIDEDPDSLEADDSSDVREDTMPSSLPMQMASDGNGAPDGPVTTETTQPVADDQLSQQGHDIQAGFVDDPRGAVRLAAKAADDALAALVTALRERQATLGSAETTEDTEVLRGALREYRQFCQGIEEIGRELPEPVSAH
jgi:hypothetical protein